MVTAGKNCLTSATAVTDTGNSDPNTSGIITLGFITPTISSTAMGYSSSLSLANSIIRPPTSLQLSRHSHGRNSSRTNQSNGVQQTLNTPNTLSASVTRVNQPHGARQQSTERLNGSAGRNLNKFRVKPTTGGNVRLSSNGAMFNSVGSSTFSPGSIGTQDEFSFISPYVKYSLFFFNLIFWVINKSQFKKK